ncbi:MAG: glycogen/starch synthase [Bacteroidota bacterium]|nr:glycogen/starch synthase [Bacteroidota bacterium]
MMKKARVLFVSQEIMPYLPETPMSTIGRYLPQGIQERKKEIRAFMPRFGVINERRNQLHEVIRLSGMNLIIDDTDHPLIIKVASIQPARMQVYFIDNEDYFHRKFVTRDKKEQFFEDNDERAVFFSRGVLETVKKLGWAPDIVHCHGWMSSLVPLYVKKAFKDNPLFAETKVICSLYNDAFGEKLNKDLPRKVKLEGISEEDLKYYENADYKSLMQSAIAYSDAIILGDENIDEDLLKQARDSGKPILEYQGAEDYIDAFNSFYDNMLEK